MKDNGDDQDEQRCCQCTRKCVAQWFKTNLLLLFMLFAMAVGIALGIGLRYLDPPMTKRDVTYLKFPGELLLNMLKMLILPLVVSSLVSGMANLNISASGKMGLRAVVYYLTTTFVAVVIGIILVLSIRPGVDSDPSKWKRVEKHQVVNAADSFLDLIRNMFPDNLVTTTFRKKKTEQILRLVNVTDENTGNTSLQSMYDPKVVDAPGMNVLGLVVFSLFLGGIISKMGARGKPLAKLFTCLTDAVMYLIQLVMWYSPIGITFLIAAQIVQMKDAAETMSKLGKYLATVLVGLIIHGYVVLPLLYLIILRKNPFRFIYNMIQAIVTALATASSSATLPVTMRCLEERNNVDTRVVKFVAPIGATINMDGTALYEAVASIFIAQLNSITLNAGQVITVSVTATLAAIGAAGVPQAGLVTMIIVLHAVGLPADDIALIYAVDWFLDRCRTSVNVLGDAIGAAIVEKLSLKQLALMDAREKEDSIELGMANGKKPEGVDNQSFVNGDSSNTQF